MHYSSRDCDTRNAGRAASVAPLERDARLDPEPRAHVSRPDLAHELVVREVSVEPLVEVVVVLLVAPELHDLAELRRRDALAILELEAVVEQRELGAISCIHASFLSRHASEKVKIHIDSEVPQILNFGGKVRGKVFRPKRRGARSMGTANFGRAAVPGFLRLSQAVWSEISRLSHPEKTINAHPILY